MLYPLNGINQLTRDYDRRNQQLQKVYYIDREELSKHNGGLQYLVSGF